MNRNHNPKYASTIPWLVAFISLLISCVAITLPYFSAGDGIVYVDAQKLVNGYKAMLDARKEFEAKTASWQTNLDTLRLELESKIKEYESTGNKLSSRERALMEELIQSKQEQFMNYQQIVTEKVKKEDQELTAKVLSKVNDYVKRYGEDKGYAIIMAATQYGNIVYAEKQTDITEAVLKGLNVYS
jgi:outer membrane protein